MQPRAIFLSGVIILGLTGLGAADVLLVEKGLPTQAVSSSSSSVAALPPPGYSPEGTSSSAGSETGVRKKAGADVLQMTVAQGFTFEDTQQETLIGGMAGTRVAVQTKVLLKDGDRAGLMAWMETPDVKTWFRTLKEALHPLFSPEVKDLLDEIQRQEGRPPRNFLTFLDPGISEERLVFVRVRDRLFEFRIAEGKEDAMYQLIEALTK